MCLLHKYRYFVCLHVGASPCCPCEILRQSTCLVLLFPISFLNIELTLFLLSCQKRGNGMLGRGMSKSSKSSKTVSHFQILHPQSHVLRVSGRCSLVPQSLDQSFPPFPFFSPKPDNSLQLITHQDMRPKSCHNQSILIEAMQFPGCLGCDCPTDPIHLSIGWARPWSPQGTRQVDLPPETFPDPPG